MSQNMELEWNVTEVDTPKEAVIHSVDYAGSSQDGVFEVLGKVMDRTVSLLDQSVLDDSRYFLTEWDADTSTLVMVVTDDHKQEDSPCVVKLVLSGLGTMLNNLKNDAESEWASQVEEWADDIQFFIRDYLTTSREFHQYSLIAVFHKGSRDKVDLL